MTTRNDVLDAVTAMIAAALPSSSVERNAVLPESLPLGGLVIVRDGDPGAPEVLLSPLTYIWSHRAVVEALVTAATPSARDAAMDALLAALGTALAANRTLDGLCDWIEPDAPQIEAVAVDGAAPLLGATIPVTLTYATSGPLA